jgi:hypothetical protein
VKKSAITADRVDDHFARLRIHHRHNRADHIPWCEELTFGTPQRKTNEDLESVADRVSISLRKAVHLELQVPIPPTRLDDDITAAGAETRLADNPVQAHQAGCHDQSWRNTTRTGSQTGRPDRQPVSSPRTAPCSHTVTPPASTHSAAKADGATTTTSGAASVVNAKIKQRCLNHMATPSLELGAVADRSDLIPSLPLSSPHRH